MTQEDALEMMKLGHNVYLAGSAGTGKTYLLKEYIRYLRRRRIGVGITASTGIAATHLDGVTIHSWSGLGIADRIGEKELGKLAKKPYLRKRFKEARVLIIDEISMLSASSLDMVDVICRSFKEPFYPFGGMQVVLCGDFFQLPPVAGKEGRDTRFAYQAHSWKTGNIRVCYLDRQFRQKGGELSRVLGDIRTGKIGKDAYDLLNSRINSDIGRKTVPIKLYTHNVDVDRINSHELAMIKGEERRFPMVADGPAALVEIMEKHCLAPEELALKRGAAVMFVRNNFDEGYVNGTLGKVVDFGGDGLPIVETFSGLTISAKPATWIVEEGGQIKATLKQVPLRLAWAITVHKSQGMSLDAAEMDLAKCFERGMGYVALSRVRSLSGIRLLGINDVALQVDPGVMEKDREFRKLSEETGKELEEIRKEEKKRRKNKHSIKS